MATDEPRCPYSVEGNGFKLLTPLGAEFYCHRCGHLLSLTDPNFLCDRWRCRQLRAPPPKSRAIPVRTVKKARRGLGGHARGSKRPLNGAKSSTVARPRKVLEDLSPIKEKAGWNRGGAQRARCTEDKLPVKDGA